MAAVPTPQYITYVDNVLPLIGTDKILVSDTDSTGIPTIEANQLTASGESIVLEDLSPYYITVPALITTSGGVWTTLPAYQYTFLYNMFVYQSALQLIRAFIERNTDQVRELAGFVDYFDTQYARHLNRLVDLLPNGAYKYQLSALATVNTGIPRTPVRYARSGSIGSYNDYIGNQLTDPQRNFAATFPFGVWGA